MTPAGVVVQAWALVVVLSMIGIGFFFVLWAGVSLLTLAGARRGRRQLSDQLLELARGGAADDLAEIDEALERILAEEHGAIPGWRSG